MFSSKDVIKLATLSVASYITILCLLILFKGGVYGSDIFNILNFVNDLNPSHNPLLIHGYPIGYLLMLDILSQVSNMNMLNYSQQFIAVFFITIAIIVFSLSRLELNNKMAGVLSAFIAASVCQFAAIMSPHYFQEVTVAATILLLSIFMVSKYEKTDNIKYLLIGLILAATIAQIHRSTLILMSLTFLFWIGLTFIYRQETRGVILKIIPIAILFVIFVLIIYIDLFSILHGSIIFSNIAAFGNELSKSTYFMNYVGWEIIPYFIASSIFLKDISKNFSRIFLCFTATCIIFSGFYLTGFSLIDPTIAWRSTYYILYVISIFASYFIYRMIEIKRYSLLLGICYASLLLFVLDWPIQKYLYRASSNTIPTRISLPILFGDYSLYVFLIIIGIILLVSFIYYRKLNNPEAKKAFVLLFILVFIMVPRGLLGVGSYYIMPVTLKDEDLSSIFYLTSAEGKHNADTTNLIVTREFNNVINVAKFNQDGLGIQLTEGEIEQYINREKYLTRIYNQRTESGDVGIYNIGR